MDAQISAYFEEAFQRIRLLKSGDKGEVWLASEQSGRLVVLKRIALTELPYRILKGKDYPLIPRILHCVEDDGETVVVEEYVQGESLLDRIGRKAYLSEHEAESVLLQLCEGLVPIHEQGIIHRDIKPSNLILQSGCVIRLIDFDAARTFKEHSSEDTVYLGTKGYAPPEQFGYGQTDARSDIYSIGVTMRKALPEEYCGYLTPIFAKCMEIDPNRRYRDVQELRRAVILRRTWAKWGKMALLTLAIASVAAFCFLPRHDVENTLQSIPAAEPKDDAPVVRRPSAAEESTAMPTPEKSADRIAAQSFAPSDAASEQETAAPASSTELSAHDSDMPSVVKQEETNAVENVDAFMEAFKDDPEKLAYWQTRNAVLSTTFDLSEEERLDDMKRIELGNRVNAFIKNLPTTMTQEERNQAIDDFVAEQRRLLGIEDW